jgi:hypothetical protein
MAKLSIGVIDLVTKAPTRTLYARVMHANLASIMPQVVAAWCEAEGHDVTHNCHTRSVIYSDPGVQSLYLVAHTPAVTHRMHSSTSTTYWGSPTKR